MDESKPKQPGKVKPTRLEWEGGIAHSHATENPVSIKVKRKSETEKPQKVALTVSDLRGSRILIKKEAKGRKGHPVSVVSITLNQSLHEKSGSLAWDSILSELKSSLACGGSFEEIESATGSHSLQSSVMILQTINRVQLETVFKRWGAAFVRFQNF